MVKGRIFDVKRYAIHDGPGIRSVVFFKGCPLRCRWCHNPEGQETESELFYRKARCLHCQECIKTCLRKALSMSSDNVLIDRKACTGCGTCAKRCPSGALSVVGTMVDVRSVMAEVQRDQPFYEESEGGVTFSGGEPLLQPSFLDTLLSECHRLDISTTVNTSGFVSYNALDRIRGKVDLFLYDIKLMNSAKHVSYTGVSNSLIHENLRKLDKARARLVITMPIVSSINDDEQDISDAIAFVSELQSVEAVNLLPYHRGGIEKYVGLGKHYTLGNLEPPSERSMSRLQKRFEVAGIKTNIGGG